MRNIFGMFFNSYSNSGYTMYMNLIETNEDDCVDIGVHYGGADTSLHHTQFSVKEVEEIIVMLQNLVSMAKKRGR